MLSYRLRGVARFLLPTSARRGVSELLNLFCGCRRAGLQEYLALRLAHGRDLRSFRAHSLRFPLMYRAGTTDSKVIIGTIVREEYATPLLPDRAGVIIDAGANVGDVSCWLLSRYPDAIVIAIEPSPDTFAVLKQNLEPYGSRAVAVNAALWSGPCDLRLGREETACATVTHPAGGGGLVTGVSLPMLLDRYGRIDNNIIIFKCNIEGADREVFGVSPERWMDRIGMIIVDTHGPDAERIVLESASRNGFSCARYG